MLFLVLGAFDYWRQNRRYLADLRMSKQELREESKEMEGNPRVRKLRREWLRRRMRPPGADRRESSAAGIIHG
jgi:flagellar biosynthesis protein FlhB